MLNRDHELLMRLPRLCVKNLLSKFSGVLLMAFAFNAIAASTLPTLPDELLLAIRSAMQAHPDVMIANSQVLSAKSQVEAGG